MGKNQNRETEFDKLIKSVDGVHAKRLNALLATMSDEDFVVAYFKALEYVRPKLQRQEIDASLEINSVTIERVDIPIEEIKKEINGRDKT